jgi:hypothetical protein
VYCHYLSQALPDIPTQQVKPYIHNSHVFYWYFCLKKHKRTFFWGGGSISKVIILDMNLFRVFANISDDVSIMRHKAGKVVAQLNFMGIITVMLLCG